MLQQDLFGDGVVGAELSPCGQYRYRLWRDLRVPVRKRCVFIGLRASTTNEMLNDQTIKRCIRYARDWGYDRVEVVNLFAIKVPSLTDLKKATDPIGPDNNRIILETVRGADLVVAAWGNEGVFRHRAGRIRRMLADYSLSCLQMTEGNEPVTPLYQKLDAAPEPLVLRT